MFVTDCPLCFKKFGLEAEHVRLLKDVRLSFNLLQKKIDYLNQIRGICFDVVQKFNC